MSPPLWRTRQQGLVARCGRLGHHRATAKNAGVKVHADKADCSSDRVNAFLGASSANLRLLGDWRGAARGARAQGARLNTLNEGSRGGSSSRHAGRHADGAHQGAVGELSCCCPAPHTAPAPTTPPAQRWQRARSTCRVRPGLHRAAGAFNLPAVLRQVSGTAGSTLQAAPAMCTASSAVTSCLAGAPQPPFPATPGHCLTPPPRRGRPLGR